MAEEVGLDDGARQPTDIYVRLLPLFAHQIEHHLFPSLSAERLRLLCPVVQEVCREFGVQYTSLSFGQLIESTHRHLEALARDQFSQPSLTAPPEP